MVWQLPQPTVLMTCLPATAAEPVGSPAGFCWLRTHAEYWAGGHTTKRNRILPCCTPQNSAHSPRYEPAPAA